MHMQLTASNHTSEIISCETQRHDAATDGYPVLKICSLTCWPTETELQAIVDCIRAWQADRAAESKVPAEPIAF